MKQGWVIKKLLDVVDFQRGLTYSKKDEVDFSENMVLRSNNVDLKTNKLDFTDIRYINSKIVIPENKKVTKGSLIICTANGSKSHLGKVALIDQDYNYAFGGFMGLIKPKENLNSYFLFHLLTSETYKKFIGDLSDGANINNLKFGDLGGFEIPLPPLSEQQRIVSILDEAFAAIDKAKANTERNLKNTKELFESCLQSHIDNNMTINKLHLLSEVCTIGDGNHSSNYPKNQEMVPSGIPFIRANNLQKGRVSWEDLKFITPEKHLKLKKGHIKVNDILFTNRGEIGKIAIIQPPFETANLNSQIVWLRCNSLLNNEYLYYYLQTPSMRRLYSDNKTGTALQQLTVRQIKEIKVPVPDLTTQLQIAHTLNTLENYIGTLENMYLKKQIALDSLKKCLLNKAFSGELTTVL